MTQTAPGGFELERERDRAIVLAEQFRRMHGCPPHLIARAPGRVNLLGEHTDYNGLPVLPMAIDRSILIAAAPRSDLRVRLQNTTARFAERTYEISDTIPPFAPGDWGNYSKAAAQYLARFHGTDVHRGADLLVDGNIPSGAGLSSSSALVVANTLALLAINALTVPATTLAQQLPAAERYVGTLSGGMDHAISLLGQAGHALRIDFLPLRTRPIPLPPGYTVIVCNSLVHAEKSGATKHAYNQRVIECRLACRVLERTLGSSLPRGLTTLGDLVTLLPGRSLLDFVACCATHLPDRPVTLADVAALIGTNAQHLRRDADIPMAAVGPFVLLRRARHVFTEAERVARAEAALQVGDAIAFGQLMNASHTSCRDDYDISCPALEELVHIAQDAGALGARLTGAGFGGCTVNLVADADVTSFLARVDRNFYHSRLDHNDRISDHRFILTPHSGASLMHL